MCRPVYPVAPVTVTCIAAPTLLPARGYLRSSSPQDIRVGTSTGSDPFSGRNNLREEPVNADRPAGQPEAGSSLVRTWPRSRSAGPA